MLPAIRVNAEERERKLEMNPEVKTLWTAGLRSGEFEQGTDVLTKDGKDCCLGVLCKLGIRAGIKVEVFTGEGGTVIYDGEDSYLPQSIMDWAGLDDSNPEVFYRDSDGDECNMSLSELNDSDQFDGRYGRIPDLIDAQL